MVNNLILYVLELLKLVDEELDASCSSMESMAVIWVSHLGRSTGTSIRELSPSKVSI